MVYRPVGVDFTPLLAQDSIDPRKDQLEICMWKLAHALSEEFLVDADDQGNIGDGIFGEAGVARFQMDVAWRQRPFKIAG
jgi:hypothetical protein